jgi:hypothetical protein
MIPICLLAFTLGCGDEPIRTVQVPKAVDNSPRTIAVMVPRADATWFFKMSGATTAVAAEEPAFRKWVGSVKFQSGEPPISWTMPEGWTRANEKRERFATMKTPSGIEATVVTLGPKQDLLQNVNRWRGQIGLKEITSKDLEKITASIKVGDTESTWVDMVNSGAAPVALQPSKPVEPAKGAATPVAKLEYQTPSGWEVLPAGGMRAAAFSTGKGEERAEITITTLGAQYGGVTANVNRWRTQIKLPEADETAIKKSAKELTVDGAAVHYFDLLGPEGEKRQRMLVIIAERGERTWFIKMTGPAETVARNQAAFESFAKSLRFPGAK